MRIATCACIVLAALALFVLASARGQVVDDPELRKQLGQLFPTAASFTQKEGNPPHYKALGAAREGGAPELLGYAYWTTELEPLERAYDGPITMLVGVDPRGKLVGILVTDHREPYGYFSIELPEFGEQFVGKDIRDGFRVGEDIDAIARATITVTSASRAVRNSSRRIARAYLAPPEAP